MTSSVKQNLKIFFRAVSNVTPASIKCNLDYLWEILHPPLIQMVKWIFSLRGDLYEDGICTYIDSSVGK